MQHTCHKRVQLQHHVLLESLRVPRALVARGAVAAEVGRAAVACGRAPLPDGRCGCPAGQYQPSGSVECRDCKTGRDSVNGSTECQTTVEVTSSLPVASLVESFGLNRFRKNSVRSKGAIEAILESKLDNNQVAGTIGDRLRTEAAI